MKNITILITLSLLCFQSSSILSASQGASAVSRKTPSCSFCVAVFATKKALHAHMKSNHPAPKLSRLDSRIVSNRPVGSSPDVYKKERKTTKICPYCVKHFPKLDIRNHIRTAHPPKVSSDTEIDSLPPLLALTEEDDV